MVRRVEASGAEQARLDAQIDLRFIEHAILQAAHRDQSLAIIAYLRSVEIAAAEGQLEVGPLTPAAAQTAAMATLHQSTFKMDEIKTPADIDQLCHDVGQQLVTILASPIEGSAPSMRPRRAATGPATTQGTDEARTLASLLDEAQHMNMAAGLRRQIVAVAEQVKTLNGDAEKVKEAASLQTALADAIDLAKGVQGSASDPETRAQVEKQLAEGLALLTDSRMRIAGQQHIDALGQYRRLLVAVGRMHLSAAQRNEFGPALAYAQKNIEQSAKIVGSLQQFMQLQQRLEIVPTAPPPPTSVRATIDVIRKRCDQKRDAFITGCADVGALGGGDGLDSRVKDFRQDVELLELLDEMPAAAEVLAGFHPKPPGALEQKIGVAASAIANPSKANLLAEAEKFLRNARGLARVAAVLNKASLNDVPPAILQSYAGVSAADVDTHWKKTVTDLATALAAGTELDAAKLTRLANARQLLVAIHEAVLLETAATKAPVLMRWVDWTLSTESLQQMLNGYRTEMSAAFAQLITNETGDALDHWKIASNGYAPLLGLLQRVSGYATACNELPEGPAANGYRLMTPIDNQPFGAERYTSFSMGLWSRSAIAGDQEAADAAFLNMVQHLRDVTKNAPATQAADPLQTPLDRPKRI